MKLLCPLKELLEGSLPLKLTGNTLVEGGGKLCFGIVLLQEIELQYSILQKLTEAQHSLNITALYEGLAI